MEYGLSSHRGRRSFVITGMKFTLDTSFTEPDCRAVDIENRPVFFFDTETTGVLGKQDRDYRCSEHWPRVVSLAWVIADNEHGIVRCAHRVIRPEGWTIPDETARVHGISTDTALEKGLPGSEVFGEMLEALREFAPAVAAAHNLDFDWRIVNSDLWRRQIDANDFLKLAPCCTLKRTIDLCKLPGKWRGYKWPTLQELHRFLFGAEFDSAHDAMSDVSALIRCYCEMTEGRGLWRDCPRLRVSPEDMFLLQFLDV